MPLTRQLSPHAPTAATLKTPKYDDGLTRHSRYLRQRQSMRAPLLPVRGMSMARGSETAYALLQNASPSSNTQPRRQTRKLPSDDLPPEASALKRRIWDSHPGSLLRFRLDKMKRVATPPVEIPPPLSDPTVLTHLVSGKPIPVTRFMWHQQRDLFKTKCRLARIREGIAY
ncbi:hypothetical protein DVH05_000242 [Phytophthora capsici]|nr:hypothetical protein DVH05_000242 [Phytophthora capsici]